MSKGGELATVGYWYYMSAHLALCHGAIDKFTKIRFGDKVVWAGSVTSTSTIAINQREIFGGDEREGGVDGSFDLIMGSKTEAVNAYLQSVLPQSDPMPAFRGKACIVLKDVAVSANNPNIRPINVEVFRLPSKGWYDSKGTPGTAGGVNPAHIIRECLVDATWGMGYSVNDLDDVSFRATADSLYSEAFGLSFVWQTTNSLQDFISTVVQHIQASLYVDPFTGLFTLKLVRMDYDPATLSVLDETKIIEVDNYERSGVSELVNQVTVIWYDTATDKQRSTTVHNTAARELQGSTVSTTIEFPGIGDAVLANKVATRELRKFSTSVSRAVIRANRYAALGNIGDVFKLRWPDLGVDDVIMRIGKVEYGNLNSGEVRIHCVEDVFSFGATLHDPSPATLWADPINPPAACPHRRVTEVPYIKLERALNESSTAISEIDAMAGFLSYQVSTPSSDAFSYKMYTRASSGTYSFRSAGIFCPTAIVANALGLEITSILNLTSIELLNQVQVGTYAYIGNECVAVTAITSNTVTVSRGILDTVPTVQAANTRIWFAENNEGIDQTQWALGVTVNAKALPTTGKGTLSLAVAPEDSLVIARRWYRPYPPGNVKVNNVAYPTLATGDLTFTWSHRDRTTQLSYYVKQNEGSFGPEAGVTYNVKVYQATNTLVAQATGLTTTSYAVSSPVTQLMLNFNGADGATTFTDSSASARPVTRYGNAVISTAQSKFGGSSLSLPDTTSKLSTTGVSLIGDFTLEMFVYWSALPAGDTTLMHLVGGSLPIAVRHISTHKLALLTSSTVITGATTLTAGAWHHVALVRLGGVLTLYLNGVSQGTYSSAVAVAATTIYLGSFNGNVEWLLGYLDAVRIHPSAVYTGAFTPPAVQPAAFGSPFTAPVRFELEAERGGLTSLYKHNISFNYS
jgi:hypothetical protein